MAWIENVAAHAPFLLTATPLFGAVLAWIHARQGNSAARQTAIINASLTLGVAATMAWNFRPELPSHGVAPVQMASIIPWWQWPLHGTTGTAGSVQISLAFGVDGISLLPLLSVALVGWIVIVTADRCTPAGVETSYAGLLLGQALSLSLFAAQDFAMFIVSCELWAWWSFFALGSQGGSDRRTAAQKLLLSSCLSHVLWGLAGIGMAVCLAWIQAEIRGELSDISFLYSHLVGSLSRWVFGNDTGMQVWTTFQAWLLVLWVAGLWLRWPLFPCHGTWTGLLSEARGPVAAFCGSTAILHGGYVFFRFVVPFLSPPVSSAWPAIVSGCAWLGAFYFGLLAISQTNWRTLGGFLSLSMIQHALLCGVSRSVDVSLMGWQMLCSASLLVASLWLLIGWWERAYSPVEFDRMSASAGLAPRWFALLALGTSLLGAIPCLSLFSGQAIGNLLEMRRRGLPNVILVTGGFLTGWTVLRALLTTGFDRQTESRTPQNPPAIPRDLQGRDWFIALPILAALLLGIAPRIVQDAIHPAWERLYDPFSNPSSKESPSTNSDGSQTPTREN